MGTKNDKIKKYKQLAVKKPKYYALIGDLYMDEADFKTAAVYYKKAIEKDVLAYAALGDTFDYRNEYKKSFDTYSAGAKEGETECFIRLSFCYQHGHAVKKDLQKAIEYYTKASDLGSSVAARNLGDLYYFEMPIKTPEIDNIKKALRFYERAFYLGDTEIAKKIGFIYLNDETLQDVPKAIEWYEKGLSLGDSSLNFDLAYVYLNDKGKLISKRPTAFVRVRAVIFSLIKEVRTIRSLSCKNPFCAMVKGLRFLKTREEQIPTAIREETTKRVNCHKNGNLPLFCIEKDTRGGVLYAPFACVLMAERKGFEPLKPVRVYTISSRAP